MLRRVALRAVSVFVALKEAREVRLDIHSNPEPGSSVVHSLPGQGPTWTPIRAVVGFKNIGRVSFGPGAAGNPAGSVIHRFYWYLPHMFFDPDRYADLGSELWFTEHAPPQDWAAYNTALWSYDNVLMPAYRAAKEAYDTARAAYDAALGTLNQALQNCARSYPSLPQLPGNFSASLSSVIS